MSRLVARYRREYLARRMAMVDRFRRMESLEEVVRQAVLALDERGKIESHQRRVGREKLQAWYARVRKDMARIKVCERSGGFGALHTLLWSARVARVGELAVYDAAVKIGAHLRIEPEDVYLHAGTRVGARALGLDGKGGVVERWALPRALQGLRADEVEDFLCIFKEELRVRGYSA